MIDRRSLSCMLVGCSFDAWSILKKIMRNASCMSMHLHSGQVSYLQAWYPSFFWTRSYIHKDLNHGPVCTNVTLSNFQSLPTEGIITPANLGFGSLAPSSRVCACVFTRVHTPLHFSRKICACMCVRLECVLSPIHSKLAEQIDTALGFLVICKSAVTVMRAAQRRRRCGKCQHVSEEWHRTSELSTWGPSASTQHTHDKAKLVQTRIIPPRVLNRESHELIHAYK